MSARTQAQILARIDEVGPNDFLGWSVELLVTYLEFEQAKGWLRDGVTAEDWTPRTDPKADCIEYLDFAWEKANDERGISANRSVDKIEQWLWLMGANELLERFRAAEYEPYGIPKLRVATEALAPDLLAEHAP